VNVERGDEVSKALFQGEMVEMFTISQVAVSKANRA
jgi:hypothetical protein